MNLWNKLKFVKIKSGFIEDRLSNFEPTAAARRACLIVLIAGIALRVAVFTALTPLGNDNHYEVIEFIVKHHALPRSAQILQAYHPPLYHLLAVPFLMAGGIKTVQLFSLILSVATLAVTWSLIRRLAWIPERFKPWCLALPALHPQFIIFTLLVSNDTLAILLGTLIFESLLRVMQRPTLRRQAALAALLGLGLLTKATFLAFIAPVALMLGIANARAGLGTRAVALRLAGLMALAAALGCYKYVENAIYEGKPLISGLDYDWAWISTQRPTWIGPQSLFDVNVVKLVRTPIISTATAHSWPLLLYGSFWYAFIPESSFRGNLLPGFNRIGSVIYLLGLVPTFLIFVGLASWLGMLSGRRKDSQPAEERIYCGIALLTLLFNLLLIGLAGWKYDIWSVFHGRLLFPSYMALILLLAEGLRWTARRELMVSAMRAFLAGLFFCFITYYAVEIYFSTKYPANPMRFNHMPYTPDMKQR